MSHQRCIGVAAMLEVMPAARGPARGADVMARGPKTTKKRQICYLFAFVCHFQEEKEQEEEEEEKEEEDEEDDDDKEYGRLQSK